MAGIPEPSPAGDQVGRRAIVRRAATAIGLTAGALAIPAMVGPAQAAAGNTMITGGDNVAGKSQTSLRTAANLAALQIENTNVTSSGPVDVVSAQLRLAAPVPSLDRPQVPDVSAMRPGDLVGAGGMLYYGADTAGAVTVPVQLHSAAFANYFQPVLPGSSTVIDTRTLSAQQRSAYAAGIFDAAGRLVPNIRMPLQLRTWVDTSHLPTMSAAVLSVTAIGADGSGVVHGHLDGLTAGDIAVAQFTVIPAAAMANHQAFGIPVTSSVTLPLDAADQLWLSTTAATHLVVQIVGLLIPDPTALVEPATIPPQLTGAALRGVQQRQAIRGMTAGVIPQK